MGPLTDASNQNLVASSVAFWRACARVPYVFACLALTMALGGCVTAGGSFCDLAKPIRPSQESLAVMSQAEVDAALEHNRTGQKLCGWAP